MLLILRIPWPSWSVSVEGALHLQAWRPPKGTSTATVGRTVGSPVILPSINIVVVLTVIHNYSGFQSLFILALTLFFLCLEYHQLCSIRLFNLMNSKNMRHVKNTAELTWRPLQGRRGEKKIEGNREQKKGRKERKRETSESPWLQVFCGGDGEPYTPPGWWAGWVGVYQPAGMYDLTINF